MGTHKGWERESKEVPRLFALSPSPSHDQPPAPAVPPLPPLHTQPAGAASATAGAGMTAGISAVPEADAAAAAIAAAVTMKADRVVASSGMGKAAKDRAQAAA